MEAGDPLQRVIGSDGDAGDRDDPPEPTPRVEGGVDIGGENVLIPDEDDEVEDDEVESDESAETRRAVCRDASIGMAHRSARASRARCVTCAHR